MYLLFSEGHYERERAPPNQALCGVYLVRNINRNFPAGRWLVGGGTADAASTNAYRLVFVKRTLNLLDTHPCNAAVPGINFADDGLFWAACFKPEKKKNMTRSINSRVFIFAYPFCYFKGVWAVQSVKI